MFLTLVKYLLSASGHNISSVLSVLEILIYGLYYYACYLIARLFYFFESIIFLIVICFMLEREIEPYCIGYDIAMITTILLLTVTTITIFV